ncbi:hypothetical protein KQI61_17970 [Anaerocolumna aminovalerica]|uniref:hypothetical protein n=1 Tax=Anaerocolumna aminovalerica TaxID=1527 RepID=UPI001C0F0EE8|nr:hypothetical protein [Anaerocolumna aminovalerica]MBU5334083.1 hypothetical protein [Anaerocolumna aminovalerica]
MKNKKIYAIALIICLLTSSLSGVYISFAKSEAIKKETSNYELSEELIEFEKLAPKPSITELEPEQYNKEELTKVELATDNIKSSEVIYEGRKIISSVQKKDIYNINENDIEELIKQGFSIQDIFQADEIANEINEDPINLLKMKLETGKTLKEVKDDVIKARKEKIVKNIQNNFKKEYTRLLEDGFKENEIISILCYMDMNNLQLTDSLIAEYKSSGEKLFKSKKIKLSEEYKSKYKITNRDSLGLTDDIVKAMEKLSKKTGKPVDELINSFNK